MHPVIFQCGPLKIYAYGFTLAVGFLVTAWLVKLEAQRQGLAAEKIFNLCFYILILGILGARFLYVLQNLHFYLRHPKEILMFQRGGLTYYGGFIVAAISAVFFLKKERLPVLLTLDLIAPYLALAQSLGRIGCFLNGCCFGKPTAFRPFVYFPGEDIPRQPVQIYASLALLLIFLILRVLQSKIRPKIENHGYIFLFYCFFYSFWRFFIEYLRADNMRICLNLTMHQIISLVIFLVSGVLLWKKRRDIFCRS